MPKRNRAAEARRGIRRAEAEADRAARELLRTIFEQSLAYALTDEAWESAPRNGNPLPTAACGGRHEGRCCGCAPDYCCFGI